MSNLENGIVMVAVLFLCILGIYNQDIQREQYQQTIAYRERVQELEKIKMDYIAIQSSTLVCGNGAHIHLLSGDVWTCLQN